MKDTGYIHRKESLGRNCARFRLVRDVFCKLVGWVGGKVGCRDP